MARRKSKKQKAIDLKMYRHFAVATISVTALLAIFADSGNREAVIDQAAQAAEAVENAELSGITLAEKPSRSEHASSYADPSTGTSYGTSPSYDKSSLRTGGEPGWVAKLHKLGITLEQFQAMSKRDQEALLRMLNANDGEVDEDKVIRTVSRASLERSGGGTGADM